MFKKFLVVLIFSSLVSFWLTNAFDNSECTTAYPELHTSISKLSECRVIEKRYQNVFWAISEQDKCEKVFLETKYSLFNYSCTVVNKESDYDDRKDYNSKKNYYNKNNYNNNYNNWVTWWNLRSYNNTLNNNSNTINSNTNNAISESTVKISNNSLNNTSSPELIQANKTVSNAEKSVSAAQSVTDSIKYDIDSLQKIVDWMKDWSNGKSTIESTIKLAKTQLEKSESELQSAKEWLKEAHKNKSKVMSELDDWRSANDSNSVDNSWGSPTRRVGNWTIKTALLLVDNKEVLKVNESDGLSLIQSIFRWIKDTLTWLLLFIAIGVFLFIWIRLGLARWNPEEFKKAMTQFVYAVIWIFIVSVAWAAVVLVAWINF